MRSNSASVNVSLFACKSMVGPPRKGLVQEADARRLAGRPWDRLGACVSRGSGRLAELSEVFRVRARSAVLAVEGDHLRRLPGGGLGPLADGRDGGDGRVAAGAPRGHRFGR